MLAAPDSDLSPLEREIFSDPAKIRAVMSDPMVNLMKTPKDLDDLDDPSLARTASISPGKKTLGTRRRMLMRKDTNRLLRKVTEVFKDDQLRARGEEV
jgi:hypothetical protein